MDIHPALFGLPIFVGFGVCLLYLLFGSRQPYRRLSPDDRVNVRFRNAIIVLLGATLGMTGFALLNSWANRPEPAAATNRTATTLALPSGRSPARFYFNQGGSCYHLGFCKFLGKEAAEITVEQAKSVGMAPCGECIREQLELPGATQRKGP